TLEFIAPLRVGDQRNDAFELHPEDDLQQRGEGRRIRRFNQGVRPLTEKARLLGPQAGQETFVEKEVLRIGRQLERDSSRAKLVLYSLQAAVRYLPRCVLRAVVRAGGDAGEAASYQDARHLQSLGERSRPVVKPVQQMTMEIAQAAHRSGVRRIGIGGRGWRPLPPPGGRRRGRGGVVLAPLCPT